MEINPKGPYEWHHYWMQASSTVVHRFSALCGSWHLLWCSKQSFGFCPLLLRFVVNSSLRFIMSQYWRNFMNISTRITQTWSKSINRLMSQRDDVKKWSTWEVWSVGKRRKGDVTRDDSQRRFLTQCSVATFLWHCFECYNVAPTLQRCVALKIVVVNRPV